MNVVVNTVSEGGMLKLRALSLVSVKKSGLCSCKDDNCLNQRLSETCGDVEVNKVNSLEGFGHLARVDPDCNSEEILNVYGEDYNHSPHKFTEFTLRTRLE